MTVSIHTEDRLLVIEPEEGHDCELSESEAIDAITKMKQACQYLREQMALHGRESMEMPNPENDLHLAK